MAKYSYEIKLKFVLEYLNRKISYKDLAEKYGLGKSVGLDQILMNH